MTSAEESFDYVVVGGGSSGCVIAGRLAENPKTRVLLLEQGPDDNSLFVRAPAGIARLIGSERSRIYTTEPQAALKQRTLSVPQGNVIGGGSSINAMVYIRGDRGDYDGWRDAGCAGWGYEDVLPYFKKAEGNQRLSEPFHGVNGPLKVSDQSYRHSFSEAVVRAAQELGFPFTADFNGASQLGFGFYQATIANGERCSAAAAYLRPALRRSANLAVRTGVRATRVVFEGRKAVGVAIGGDGGERVIGAWQGVVLTAGALSTPKILMLSGVGPAAHLAGMDIPVVHDLPGVGANFQDHLMVPVMARSKQPISYTGEDRGLKAVSHYVQWRLYRTGMLTTGAAECGGFVDLDGDGRSDLQFICSPHFMGDAERPPPPGHGLTINAQSVRPRSRGSVRLRSPWAADEIVFDPNYLSEWADVEALMAGVKLARRMLRMPSLRTVISDEIVPGGSEVLSEAAVEDHVRAYAKTVFHPSGTCRMGTDAGAVVDPRLAVHGVENLHIGDASVMPTVPSGNTNAPTIMIGERCAEFLREKESGQRIAAAPVAA